MSTTAIQNEHGLPQQFGDIALTSLDGTALRGRLWVRPNPRATLVIAHGLGEHGGSYRRTAEDLGSALDLDIFAFDFRGSGRSSGKRGVVRRYDDLTLDLAAALNWMTAHQPNLPRFLLGHSNGGLVSLKTVLSRDLGLTGLIVSNPPLRLTAHVPTWKRIAGEILLRIAPGITLETGLTNDQMTHDPLIIAEIAEDSLRHSRISPPLFFGMTAGGPQVMARAGEILVPTLMILGGSDPIIDPHTGLKFFEKLGAKDKTLKIYPAMRHEPLNEIGRKEVIGDLANWIEGQLGRKP
jgi:alpha-beta hydrolase superfamily lysophospholipase